jgi:hypothetical protein
MATRTAEGEGVAGTIRNAHALLEASSDLPPPAELEALLEWVFLGRGLYLYAR